MKSFFQLSFLYLRDLDCSPFRKVGFLTVPETLFQKLQDLNEIENRLFLLLSKSSCTIAEIAEILNISKNYAYFLICQLDKKIKVSKITDLNNTRQKHYFIEL